MSASQFTIYSSSDPGNGSDQPGLIFGSAGDLLRILDKCLVNGYTGKTAAGWTKPFVNASNSGCYKQGAGALCALHVQDNGGNVTSTFKEAWGTGWETITAVSATVGTGTGQFPTPAQLLTTGHVAWRKSLTADSTTGRPWFCFADSSTFYLFILSEGGTAYRCAGFGDLFSLKGSSDTYRCFIMGGSTENAAVSTTDMDTFGGAPTTISNAPGMYAPRGFGGGGTSVGLIRVGDFALLASVAVNLNSYAANIGILPSPNGPDNSWYIYPYRVCESASHMRGRLRGIYGFGHPIAAISDGQVIQGSNDFAGKTFQAIKTCSNAGVVLVETSATVETN